MASINISEDTGWVGAAWVLRAIARGMERFGSFPSLKESFEAVEAGVQYLDLTELNETERNEFRRVAPLIVNDVKEAGAQALADPKFYAGFVAALEDFERIALSAWRPSK